MRPAPSAAVLWRASSFSCGLGSYCVHLRLDGFLTRRATRLVLAGGQNSFAVAARLLVECCGWKVSDELIRLARPADRARR